VPLYLAGARLLSFHPLSIIVHGLALNITIQTYAGQVDFGVVADKKALPHAQDLASAIEAAFAEAQALLAYAAPSASTAPASPEKPGKTAARKPKALSSRQFITPQSVKTPRTLVPKATKTSKLEKPLSTTRRKRADTVS
jgi:diacylglycerol O-acyltransferase / wax synthase